MHFSLQTFYNHFPEGQRTTAIFHLYKTAQVQNSFSTNASINAIAYRLSNNAGGHFSCIDLSCIDHLFWTWLYFAVVNQKRKHIIFNEWNVRRYCNKHNNHNKVTIKHVNRLAFPEKCWEIPEKCLPISEKCFSFISLSRDANNDDEANF